MKRSIFFTVAFICMVSLGCGFGIPFSGTVKGSGQIARETRPLSGFTGVDLQAVGDVTITIAEVDSVVVEADDNILPLLKTEVVGGQLRISKPAGTKISVENPIRFTVTMKTLENASVSGTGDMKVDGLDSDLVNLNLSGTGCITANGKAGTLNISMPGTGRITAKGKAGTLNVNLTDRGNGNIACDGLEADIVTARLGGTGDITVRAGHSLEAAISGTGTVNYHGDPTTVTRSVTGHGSINRLP